MAGKSYRAALVTGATSGIGEAFAHLLPRDTDLLLTGRDADRLARLAAALAYDGRRIETLVADLATMEGIETVTAAAEAFGIDLLINNAGLGRFGRVIDNDLAFEQAMVQVNVVAPLVLTRMLLPGMLARAKADGRRAGVIIVASVVGFGPIPYVATYAATKAFDLYLAAGLAAEMADEPVDVLALCPGTTETRFFERAGMPRQRRAHSPDRVAREGLEALGHRHVHVVGALNAVVTLVMRRIPMRMLTWCATKAMAWRRMA
ncbi:MAG TPA: SDR family NAD(P)-dependent oxidoreductase [Stellaceae bacterium]|nr:SDR family NAD(P)-dependent oxidoreductase [Stellaceae bacterium]